MVNFVGVSIRIQISNTLLTPINTVISEFTQGVEKIILNGKSERFAIRESQNSDLPGQGRVASSPHHEKNGKTGLPFCHFDSSCVTVTE